LLDNRSADSFFYNDDGNNTPCILTETSNLFSYSAVANSSNTYYVTPTNRANSNDGEILMKVNGNSMIITEQFDGFVETMTFIRD